MSIISSNQIYFIGAFIILVLLMAWAYATKRMQKDFNTLTWVLIPVAIAINLSIGYIVTQIKLPIYLDSIGTVLVAIVCGPWAGALTGFLANIIGGLIIDPNFFPWFPVAFVIGLVAGWCAIGGLFKSWWKVVIAGFIVAVAAAPVSSLIQVAVYGGITASGSSFFTAYLLQTGQNLFNAVLSTNFLAEPVDKISTAMLAFAIIQGLSKRYLARYPRPENIELKEGVNSRNQLFLAVGIALVLILLAAFVLKQMLTQ